MQKNKQLPHIVIAITAILLLIAQGTVMYLGVELGWIKFFYAPAIVLCVAIIFIRYETNLGIFLLLSFIPTLLEMALYPDSSVFILFVQGTLVICNATASYLCYVTLRSIRGYGNNSQTPSTQQDPGMPSIGLPIAYASASIVLAISLYIPNMFGLLSFIAAPAIGLYITRARKEEPWPFMYFILLSTAAPFVYFLNMTILYGKLGNLWPFELFILFAVSLISTTAMYYIDLHSRKQTKQE